VTNRELSEHQKATLVRKHARLVPDAWNRYLAKLKKGEYYYPLNEADMRCHIFCECLGVMRRKGFDKPYEIFAEDKEIYEGKRADLVVGLREKEGAAFLAVELKHHRTVEEIKEDILKLREAVKEKAFWGFFLMLGPETYRYRSKLDLNALDIEEDGRDSAFTWSKIKPKSREAQVEALFLFMRHPQS